MKLPQHQHVNIFYMKSIAIESTSVRHFGSDSTLEPRFSIYFDLSWPMTRNYDNHNFNVKQEFMVIIISVSRSCWSIMHQREKLCGQEQNCGRKEFDLYDWKVSIPTCFPNCNSCRFCVNGSCISPAKCHI